MPPIIPVILCGGAGKRLWPLSCTRKPKQFHVLGGVRSLFQDTLLRCQQRLFDAQPIIVTSAHHQQLVEEQVQALGLVAELVLEPAPRESCAAIIAGCLQALKRDSRSLVLVLASDHHIADGGAFAEAVVNAAASAGAGHLVTFGLRPTRAATGYGYIEAGEELGRGGARNVLRFVEKPTAAFAARYMADGYFWNSGNFLFQASTLLAEAAALVPNLHEAVLVSHAAASHAGNLCLLDEAHFARAPAISFDHAIMEKTEKAAVMPVSYGWSDIGTWDAVRALLPHDEQGNAVVGDGVQVTGCNNLVHVQGLRCIVDADNLIVVSTPEGLLITRRGEGERVKELLSGGANACQPRSPLSRA